MTYQADLARAHIFVSTTVKDDQLSTARAVGWPSYAHSCEPRERL